MKFTLSILIVIITSSLLNAYEIPVTDWCPRIAKIFRLNTARSNSRSDEIILCPR